MISSFLLCGVMNLIFCHLFYCFSFKVSDPLVFHFTANEQTYSGCYGVLWGRQPPVLPTPALQHVWLAWARISFTPEASWYYLSGIIFCVHACIHVCVCLCKSLLRCLAVLKYSSANKKTYKKKKSKGEGRRNAKMVRKSDHLLCVWRREMQKMFWCEIVINHLVIVSFFF